MAYSFNRSDGTAISVANDAIDNTYSLGLIGRNTVDYGLTMAKKYSITTGKLCVKYSSLRYCVNRTVVV